MLFLSSSVLAIPTIRSGAPQPTDILFFSSILIAAFSAEATRRNIDEALLAFVHLNYHLAVVSLLLFPLVFILPNLIVPVPDALQNFLDSEINGDRRFYTIFGLTYFATNSGVDGIWRNQSIFWEPGMLGFISVLSLALADAFGVGLRKRIVFVLTTLSTFAPGAYALLIIYFGLKLMRSGRKGVLRPLFTLVIFAVGAAATLPMLRELLLLLFGRDIYMDPSIYIRSTDFWLPYAVALKSPFFGFGSIEPYQIAMQIAIERRMDGITNSVGSYFYRYGYIWALGFLIWVITSFSRGSRPFVLIPIVMLLGVMYEPIGFSAVFLFLVFLARASR
ncbi:hypothetical protein SAMN05421751_12816 [Jhaorihella thermophila]|uniref:Uncharacterized protein n=2 Tax=Jhaorihella thermophila TaxID=488547 RepID=A0A1H5Z310_9RHOB|nr:hypothetical protein SAMN05421751_12816 [Jhaorihella thermophila]